MLVDKMTLVMPWEGKPDRNDISAVAKQRYRGDGTQQEQCRTYMGSMLKDLCLLLGAAGRVQWKDPEGRAHVGVLLEQTANVGDVREPWSGG